MTAPVWPVTVPYESSPDRWSIKPVRAPLKTEMEAGNVRIRRRPGDNLKVMRWGRMLSTAELADFNTFLETTIYGGAGRFTMQVSLDGATYVSRLVLMDAETIEITHLGGLQVAVSFAAFVFPAAVTE